MHIYRSLLKANFKNFTLALNTIEKHYGKILKIKKLSSLSNYCFFLKIKSLNFLPTQDIQLFLKIYNLNEITKNCDETKIIKGLSKQNICASMLLNHFPKYIVMSYIQGKPPTRGYFNNEDNMYKLFELVKNIHQKANINLTNTYIDHLKSNNILLKKLQLIPEAQYLIKVFKYLTKKLSELPTTISFSHNDLNSKNFIIDKNDKIWCIDFEYSGLSDVFFDLLTLKPILNKVYYDKFLLKYNNELIPQMSDKIFKTKIYYYNFVVLTTTVTWYLYMREFCKSRNTFYCNTFIKLFTKLNREFEKHFANTKCKSF